MNPSLAVEQICHVDFEEVFFADFVIAVRSKTEAKTGLGSESVLLSQPILRKAD